MRAAVFLLLNVLFPLPALASGSAVFSSALWAVPFVGVLLSIAIFPLLLPNFWHHHFGKIVAAWAAAFLLPAVWLMGLSPTLQMTAHILFADYIPFIILITALYIISGGIYIKGNLHGSPKLNTLILLAGSILANIMGTTGAAMLLIRPLLRANDNRRHKTHVVVFFVFLVANIGGAFTPLGDPPLFLGFLKGVPFFWTAQYIWRETILLSVALLALFYAIDSFLYHAREEEMPAQLDPTPDTHTFGFEGGLNFVWLAGAIGFVLLSGMWQPNIAVDVFGIAIELQNIVRDVGLIAMTGLAYATTEPNIRVKNQFSFAPMLEVGKLFLAIFITISPVIAMLHMGANGSFAWLVNAAHDATGTPIDARYFWASGMLSGFLDSAPAYLVFFNLAGGDAAHLTAQGASTLAAISAGTVFMGALSYIGNAPNLMVKAVAEHGGVKMPSFFGFIAWSFVILMPMFIVMTFLFY